MKQCFSCFLFLKIFTSSLFISGLIMFHFPCEMCISYHLEICFILFYRFYIQCDSCTEWYHGGCIGILKSEADLMDTYKCISCDSFSFVNYTNQKPLQLSDYEGLKQLLEELKASTFNPKTFYSCYIQSN